MNSVQWILLGDVIAWLIIDNSATFLRDGPSESANLPEHKQKIVTPCEAGGYYWEALTKKIPAENETSGFRRDSSSFL